VTRKLGDRRIRPRYDIVGDLWGTVETMLRLPLRNVSPSGALVESDVPLPSGSIHRVTFPCNGHEVATQIRIRHSDAVVSADGGRMYLIGVEFLSLHPALVGQIDRWMAAGGE